MMDKRSIAFIVVAAALQLVCAIWMEPSQIPFVFVVLVVTFMISAMLLSPNRSIFKLFKEVSKFDKVVLLMMPAIAVLFTISSGDLVKSLTALILVGSFFLFVIALFHRISISLFWPLILRSKSRLTRPWCKKSNNSSS
jgi:hypothetical protein